MLKLRFMFCSMPLLWAATAGGAEQVDFNRDVLPILSDKCYQCHGPDAKTREADLRLDNEDGAFADLGGYAAFKPGSPDDSAAIERIFSDDPDEQMPPPKSKLRLTAAEKQQLRRWVVQGAPWSKHWAFTAPSRPVPPPVTNSDWPRNEIDRFVHARLVDAGLEPSPAPRRETLIRRVTLDLTGLPPTPEEVAAFLADSSAGAYERVVDRLLKSPAYGERMAWEWLDAARYADTDGFQGDPTRTMWPWRDWLIRALNDNMPFDQFTIEMLAGDLLPDATPEQVIATGFNRNHMHNGEGGRIAEETRIENVFDRTETTSTVWLGLTMTCARCHDHKFDPIKQKEYYGLFAFFNNTSERGNRGGGKAAPIVNYLPPDRREKLAEVDLRIAEHQRRMDAPLPDDDQRQAAWEAETIRSLGADRVEGKLTISNWHALGPLPAPNGDGAKAFGQDLGPEQGVNLSRTYADGKIAWREAKQFVDGKVHELPDTVGATYLYRKFVSSAPRNVDLSLGSDDGIKVWLNGAEILAKNVARAAAPDQEKVKLELREGENELLIKIVNTGGIAGFYFRKADESVGGLPSAIAQALQTEVADRSEQQQHELRRYYREHHSAHWKTLNNELIRLNNERAQVNKATVTVMVMDELPADRARKTSILMRGIYNKPLAEVVQGTPEFLPPLPEGAPRDRLTLARWLVEPAHPLTARVTVNRYWQMFFGTGLVRTSEDFGRQGSLPSHPQLLDWLATRFVDSGWDVKALHKLIVTSATYRQSVRVTKDQIERDPGNRLLARGSRYRMPSWMLRDQALALSGLLADRMGGPSVKPYQPAGIWAEATFGKIRYQPDKGEALYRRSLYIFWRRIVGPTMLFDSGKRQTCEVKPTRTNTPLHALTTLNETTFVEAARAMAQRALHTIDGTPEQRLAWAFQLATARSPKPSELAVLVRRWGMLKEEFAASPEDAKKLLSVGASGRDEKLDVVEHAAYTVVCSMLLNLDEVLNR